MNYSSTLIDNDSIIDTIWAMRGQEESSYKTYDYLYQQFPQSQNNFAARSLAEQPADSDCRFRMAEWCYQIIDFCKFNRETVAIAMSCLDRFLCSPGGYSMLLDRSMFQLAAMAAFYTAVKIHEPEAMDPSIMAGLSRGAFSKEQIEEMELKILNSIQWRVNPPTAMSFLHQFLSLIPNNFMNEEERETALELAKFQTEVAVSDPSLIGARASTIALASLVNAFDSMNMGCNNLSHLQTILSNVSKVDTQTPLFRDIRIRLYEDITGQSLAFSSNLAPQNTQHNDVYTKTNSKAHELSRPVSPRSVSATAI